MTDASLLPPVPVPDPDSASYWESLHQGTLSICRCTGCRRWMHPPLESCRYCGAPTTLERVSGRGFVFSFIVVRRATVPGFPPPYVIALVELAEQAALRMPSIVTGDPDSVSIGMSVQAKIAEIGKSGFFAPIFEPTAP